ncbi:hypothetical protein DL96DRAFT_1815090 [Flagelloscypha sp. PMI_526]|nr:hypothetical protein DL96DRAFT_1815090 [Flagelloscypha sp. PMI_526]
MNRRSSASSSGTGRFTPPSWRPQHTGGPSANQTPQGKGKIFISNLPTDVRAKEVDDLFNKTIGPVVPGRTAVMFSREAVPLGMAVVEFQKEADAIRSRERYNGKTIDGARRLKIELVIDGNPKSQISATPTSTSLFSRLNITPVASAPISANPSSILSGPKRKVRKGPKRLKKVQQKMVASAPVPKKQPTVADLDADMDAYKAAASPAS